MKYVIVGGVAGGATAAARLRRLDENAQIVLFERGQYVSFANCGLPYYVGETIRDRRRLLVQTPDALRARFNLFVRTNSEVVAVDTEKKFVTVQANGRRYTETFDKLLLAPGAKPAALNIPGADNPRLCRLRNVDDVDWLKQAADNAASHGHATVIGGGFIGIEVAENLVQRGIDVTLIESAPQILSPLDGDMVPFIEKELRQNGVRLLLNSSVTSFESAENGVHLHLHDGQILHTDFVVSALGVTPDTDFLAASPIARTPDGHIRVDDELRTSCPDIYAVGDAIQLFRFSDGAPMALPLAGPANHQARLAADNMNGAHRKCSGLQGSAIIKVFGVTAATTGVNEKTLRRENQPYHTVILHPFSHATYYPGAQQMTLKVIFTPEGRLCGAQAVGANGVDKRIDILAAMIRQNADVRDLMALELCYAPPFSSAKDPVNMAGYMADNVLCGLTSPIDFRDLKNAIQSGARLIDVRSPAEFNEGHLDGAENFPLDKLRTNLTQLDPTQSIIVYCQVGLRGYYAERLLSQKGFSVRNLNGGYRLAALLSEKFNA